MQIPGSLAHRTFCKGQYVAGTEFSVCHREKTREADWRFAVDQQSAKMQLAARAGTARPESRIVPEDGCCARADERLVEVAGNGIPGPKWQAMSPSRIDPPGWGPEDGTAGRQRDHHLHQRLCLRACLPNEKNKLARQVVPPEACNCSRCGSYDSRAAPDFQTLEPVIMARMIVGVRGTSSRLFPTGFLLAFGPGHER